MIDNTTNNKYYRTQTSNFPYHFSLDILVLPADFVHDDDDDDDIVATHVNPKCQAGAGCRGAETVS